MGQHAVFSPSAAHRWLACPGSLPLTRDLPEQESSFDANQGSAAHALAARALTYGKDADFFLGEQIQWGPHIFVVDEEMAAHVQTYLTEVRARAVRGHLLFEQKLDLASVLGPGQFGTADAIIHEDSHVTVVDFKYGYNTVEAGTPDSPNPQLALYAIGALDLLSMVLPEAVEKITLVIWQPRANNFPEVTLTFEELCNFGATVRAGVQKVWEAEVNDARKYLHAGPKQCRWCAYKPLCPELARWTQEQVGSHFDELALNPDAGEAAADDDILSAHMRAAPLVELWCGAVRAEVSRRVAQGARIIGSDGQPMKMVEGRAGNRAWISAEQAEGALVGQLADKAYSRQILTPSAAAKILDKKQTKALWADMFVPLIHQPRGKPIVVEGSDPRPPYSTAASADDFNIGADNDQRAE